MPIYGSLSHSWYSWIPLSYICLLVKSLVPIHGSLSHGIHGCLFPSVIYAYGSKAWYLSMVAKVMVFVDAYSPQLYIYANGSKAWYLSMVAEVMIFMDAYSPQLYMLMGQEPGAYLW